MKVIWENYLMGSRHKLAKNSLMQNLSEYPLPELKLIYSLLHSQVLEQPALMDSNILQDLQSFLQSKAAQDNIDVSAHAEWAAWLSGLNT